MQFRLSTLLWLFVVVWSSMAMVSALGDDPYLPVWIGSMVVWMFAGVTLYFGFAAARRWIASFFKQPEPSPIVSDPLPPLFLWLVAVGCAAYLLAMGCTDPREPMRRASSANKLKCLGLALHWYAQDHGGCFPPAYVADKTGKRMHSWRALILPHVSEGPTPPPKYRASEAWDGPTNKKSLNQAPRDYLAPEEMQSPPATSPNNTSYVAVIGADAAWRGDAPVRLGDLHGQLSKTVLLIEVANSGIAWTEPRDVSWADAPKLLTASPGTMAVRIRRIPSGIFFQGPPESVLVLLADGSIGQLSGEQLTPAGLQTALTVGGYVAHDLRPPGWGPNWRNCCTLLVWTASIYVLLRRLAANTTLTPAGQGSAPRISTDEHR